jgi:sulfatase modifying factor 1
LAGATSGVSFTKNVGATVWIPSEIEWYKAVYYDPNKGGIGVGGYWAQAT